MRKISLMLCLLLLPQLLAAQDAQPAAGSQRVRVVTNAGNFVIELDHNRAPRTVDAFMKYEIGRASCRERV